MIPKLLYRGDADSQKKRGLRSCYPGSSYSCLRTNLCNGGSGQAIFSLPLVSTVTNHVAVGWDKTHYLSFSESRDKALEFASGRSSKRLEPVDGSPWDAALMTLDTDLFTSCAEVTNGVYRCTYSGKNIFGSSQLSIAENVARQLNNAPHAGCSVEILVIDVVSFLRTSPNPSRHVVPNAIANAERDSEWLVLPINLSEGVAGEFTGLLDDACIVGFERFRFGEIASTSRGAIVIAPNDVGFAAMGGCHPTRNKVFRCCGVKYCTDTLDL